MDCKRLQNAGEYFYLREYLPWNCSNHGDLTTIFDRKIMDIKNYSDLEYRIASQNEAINFFYKILHDVLYDERNSGLVLSYVPRSEVDAPSHVRQIAKRLCSALNLVDGTSCLKRRTSIKPAHESGIREFGRHRESIEIIDKYILQGSLVLLLDDVATTGRTIYECQDLLFNAGAKRVNCLVFGKTIWRRA